MNPEFETYPIFFASNSLCSSLARVHSDIVPFAARLPSSSLGLLARFLPHIREKKLNAVDEHHCAPLSFVSTSLPFLSLPVAAYRRPSLFPSPVAFPFATLLISRPPCSISSPKRLKLFEALFVVHRNSAIFVVHRNSVSTKYDDEWKYIEEGPPEIIWKGNEIIVNKNKVKVKKKEANQSTQKEDPDRPTSNPLPPQSEAYAAFKNAPIASTELLDIVSQQVPNFGTEKDKAHCPFYIKTGACRFGMRCNRFISTLINLPHCLSRTCTMDLAMLRNKMRDLRSVVGFSL
ncbi:unnamed protein product [Lactuca virosa]|uniref:C3H1-type domain-containing protein n=1 Tax=Lactuca virosa TaxID=75947 RepID=A0AAU9MTG3_9ASTR|nr:unnamed protein product [Lactuca virosa]CAH1430387.1 unnamed protein product [Lactuca virosa]